MKMYGSSENAYAALDFCGAGVVTLKDFMNSTLVKIKLLPKYSEQSLTEFLKHDNVFVSN